MSTQDQSPQSESSVQPSSDLTPELTALTKKSWFKKGIIFLGTLFVLLVATAVIVPLVVKVDRFRPEITAKINERLNGTAELGPLSLSLWGQIKVKIDSFKLMDAQKRPVVTVGEAYFHVPFSSIFSQAPLITLTMNRPEISVIKESNGKMNIMSLLKASESSQQASPSTTSTSTAGTTESTKVPAIVAQAKMGIALKKSKLTYKDQVTQSTTQVDNLDILVKDLSLTRKTELSIDGEIQSRSPSYVMQGPFEINAELTPVLNAGQVQGATIKAHADFNKVVITSGDLFKKDKGVTAVMDLALETDEKTVKLKSFKTQFFNATITGDGQMTKIKSNTPEGAQQSQLDFTFKSNDIELKSWSKLIPMLNEYDLTGHAKMRADLSGPSDRFEYGVVLTCDGLTAKSPGLKVRPEMGMVLKIKTDQIEDFTFQMKAPGNDLKMTGSLKSFSQPKIKADIVSNQLDLDQLMIKPTVKADAQKGVASAPSTLPASNYDQMLEPLRSNPIMKKASGQVNWNLQLIKNSGIDLRHVEGRAQLNNLVASIDSFSMQLFKGIVSGNAQTNLNLKQPTYDFKVQVKDLDMKNASESQSQTFKNTVLGNLNFQMSGSGQSYNVETAKANLKSNGHFDIQEAVFTNLDIGKMAIDSLNQVIDKVGDKIPGIKEKKIQAFKQSDARYQTIAADFSINNGRFVMPNFIAKAQQNHGIDINGETETGLVDRTLKAKWILLDTYDLTKAKSISVQHNGIQVDHILTEGDSPLRVPVEVGCTIDNPCPNYANAPGAIVAVALKNVEKAIANKAKSVVTQKVGQATKKADDKVKGILKGITGGLFGK